MANVTITYSPIADESLRSADSIFAQFQAHNSYVESNVYENGTGNYGRSIYATNVCGWGKLLGLFPLASTPIKLAYMEQAIQEALAAEAAGQPVPSITVEIDSQEDLLWWKMITPNLEDQGFTFEIGAGGGATSPIVGEGQADFAVLTE